MTVHWLTYRIADRRVAGRTYEDRYLALEDAIRARSTKWWLDPTSFILFESAEAALDIARACREAIAPSHDMFLMRVLDRQLAYICGAIEDDDVFKLIPYLKKL